MLSIFGDSIYCFEYYMHFIHIQEFRRQYGKKMGLEPEHPRAGLCHDVEGIFALLHTGGRKVRLCFINTLSSTNIGYLYTTIRRQSHKRIKIS
jgi:hypothetical protein